MNVRLTQIDGKLPNLALMALSAHHKARGDAVHFSRRVHPDMFEPEYDRVYASAIFKFSAPRLERFREQWPDAIVGGTGAGDPVTVEATTGRERLEYDYTIYPDFVPSIGFTQRGCRLKCKFCVVPSKEGKNRSTHAISEIWRGDGHPKKIILLDNDFFGQEDWRTRLDEIRDGGFKISLNQGINIRLINDESAEGLASIEYRDDQFQQRRLYTAWDNLKDEKIFFRGVETLARHGIPPEHLMVYMLCGFAKDETFDRVMYRFEKMVDLGIKPYPMVYDRSRRDLLAFQRWAVMGLYRAVPWEEYQGSRAKHRLKDRDAPLFESGTADD